MHLCEWAAICVREPVRDGTFQQNVSTGLSFCFFLFSVEQIVEISKGMADLSVIT